MTSSQRHPVSRPSSAASSTKPDLVVLDLILPDLNGLEMLRRLRELHPDGPVVMGTADNQDLTRLQALSLGAARYLVKPYPQDHVKEALAGLLTL